MSPPAPAAVAVAQRIARLAARRGRPVSACPYDPTGTPTQRLLALAFVREFRRHVPSATDYTT